MAPKRSFRGARSLRGSTTRPNCRLGIRELFKGRHRTQVPLLPLLRNWAKRLLRKEAVGSRAGPLSARQGANGRQERIGARAPARAPISLLLLAHPKTARQSVLV
jgi:hypothetical protein